MSNNLHIYISHSCYFLPIPNLGNYCSILWGSIIFYLPIFLPWLTLQSALRQILEMFWQTKSCSIVYSYLVVWHESFTQKALNITSHAFLVCGAVSWSWASHMLGKCLATELNSQPFERDLLKTIHSQFLMCSWVIQRTFKNTTRYFSLEVQNVAWGYASLTSAIDVRTLTILWVHGSIARENLTHNSLV